METARRMQAEVLRATGVPVRVGIGSTKVLSKVAAVLAKRDPSSTGVVSLLDYGPEALLQVLETISVEEVWGLGKRSCDQLRLRRIATGRALSEADPAWVRRFLSVTGQRIVYELRGVSCLPLEVNARPKQEIVVARSFGRPIEREADLAEAVAHYVAWAAEKLRGQGSVAGDLRVFVSTSRFEPPPSQYAANAGTHLLFPTNFTADLIAAAHRVLQEVYRPGVRYQRAGVVLRALGSQEVLQADLFGDYSFEREARKARLVAVVDIVNRLMGRDTLIWGAQGLSRWWRPRASRLSPRSTTRLGDLLSVSG